MKKLGVDKFAFEILEEVEIEKLKEKEQEFIQTLKPTYNSNNAKGLNIEKNKKYEKTDKRKKAKKKYYSRLCCYNGETLTLNALAIRFRRAGIDHPTLEAKKYLLEK